MKKPILLIATLLAALTGGVYAQAPASNDPIVQMHTEERAADKVYKDKKAALDKPHKAKIKAAGDKAAADASAKGQEPGVARRNAEAKVKAETKADYDAQLKAIKKEHSDALAAIKKKYAAAPATPATPATPK
jgi:hypothetical protein